LQQRLDASVKNKKKKKKKKKKNGKRINLEPFALDEAFGRRTMGAMTTKPTRLAAGEKG